MTRTSLRSLALLAMGGLLALAAWLFIAERKDELPAPVSPREQPSETATPGPALKASGRDEVHEEGGDARSTADLATLAGTVHELRPDGTSVPVERGTLYLELWSPQDVLTKERVPVQSGRFSAQLPRGDRVEFRKIDMDAKRAHFVGKIGHLTVPNDLPIALRVRRPLPTTLRVIDAETRALLRGVRVVAPLGQRNRGLSHPGAFLPVQVLAGAATSPVPIKRVPWRLDSLWVHAPGYAWQRIKINRRQGGERLVALAPGGSVAVHLIGEPMDRFMAVRIYHATELDDAPVTQLGAPKEDSLEVGGLAPGDYLAVVETGEWYRSLERHVAVPFRVEAGALVDVTLDVPPAVPMVAAPIAGVVVLPAEWKLEAFEMTYACVDRRGGTAGGIVLSSGEQLVAVPGQAGTWRFMDEDVRPGLVEFVVQETGFRAAFTIPVEGHQRLRIEVPPPARVSLLFTDSTTGEAAKLAAPTWHYELPEGVSSYSPEDTDVDPQTGRYDFIAPVGRVHVDPGFGTFVEGEITLDIHPGVNKHDLSITPAGSVLIVVKDGDVVLPDVYDLEIDVRQIDGPGRRRSQHGGEWGCQVYVSEPGRYRVTVPEIKGFKRLAPREVNIAGGAREKIVFELERK